MPRQWVEFLTVESLGEWMIQWDPTPKRRELEEKLQETVRSLAVRDACLVYTAGTECELHAK